MSYDISQKERIAKMDREKVVEILQKAKTVIETWVPMFEQYNTPAGIDDAIALLKEQEAVPLIHSAGYEEYWDVENICPKCNARWISLAEDHFCPQCGQAVK